MAWEKAVDLAQFAKAKELVSLLKEDLHKYYGLELEWWHVSKLAPFLPNVLISIEVKKVRGKIRLREGSVYNLGRGEIFHITKICEDDIDYNVSCIEKEGEKSITSVKEEDLYKVVGEVYYN